MFFCLVKYSLSGYYGRIPGFRMEEMSPDVVKRKRQICLETLEVIEKIDLGIGIRKGWRYSLSQFHQHFMSTFTPIFLRK
jgi:hypothetical protein